MKKRKICQHLYTLQGIGGKVCSHNTVCGYTANIYNYESDENGRG